VKLIHYLLASMLLTFSGLAASIEGDIKLNYTASTFSEGVFKKEFGDVVKATCKWRAGEFFGRETVFAGIAVKNTGDKSMFFQYCVSFFDKDKKLVAAADQGFFGDQGLKPGAQTDMSSCLIHLPKDKYKEIVSYQAVIYETDIAPKKK
jgi:hypothetical protein